MLHHYKNCCFCKQSIFIDLIKKFILKPISTALRLLCRLHLQIREITNFPSQSLINHTIHYNHYLWQQILPSSSSVYLLLQYTRIQIKFEPFCHQTMSSRLNFSINIHGQHVDSQIHLWDMVGKLSFLL